MIYHVSVAVFLFSLRYWYIYRRCPMPKSDAITPITDAASGITALISPSRQSFTSLRQLQAEHHCRAGTPDSHFAPIIFHSHWQLVFFWADNISTTHFSQLSFSSALHWLRYHRRFFSLLLHWFQIHFQRSWSRAAIRSHYADGYFHHMSRQITTLSHIFSHCFRQPTAFSSRFSPSWLPVKYFGRRFREFLRCFAFIFYASDAESFSAFSRAGDCIFFATKHMPYFHYCIIAAAAIIDGYC